MFFNVYVTIITIQEIVASNLNFQLEVINSVWILSVVGNISVVATLLLFDLKQMKFMTLVHQLLILEFLLDNSSI